MTVITGRIERWITLITPLCLSTVSKCPRQTGNQGIAMVGLSITVREATERNNGFGNMNRPRQNREVSKVLMIVLLPEYSKNQLV